MLNVYLCRLTLVFQKIIEFYVNQAVVIFNLIGNDLICLRFVYIVILEIVCECCEK